MTMATKDLGLVRAACQLEPDDRDDDRIGHVVDFVREVKFFTKLTGRQQYALAKKMAYEAFDPNQFIFQMGDTGDKFFVILSGAVSVQVPSTTACPKGIHQSNCDCPGRPMETIVYLEPGTGFGELALQSDEPRSASILTTEFTEVLVTKRADYMRYFLEQRVRFLRRFPRIEDALQRCLVSTQEVAAMATCLKEVVMGGNDILVKQGDEVDNMIFVQQGQLAMLRVLDLDEPREANGEICPPPAPPPDRNQQRGSKSRGASRTSTALSVARGPEGAEGGLDGASFFGRDAMVMGLARMMLEQKELIAAEAAAAAAAAEAAKQQAAEGMKRGSVALAEAAGRPGRRRSSGGIRKWWPRRASAEDTRALTRAQELWFRVQAAWRRATLLNRLRQKPRMEEKSAEDAGMQHVQQLLDVSAARTKYASWRSKELAQKKLQGKGASPNLRRTTTCRSSRQGAAPLKRKKLLRIGTVRAFQYFGDRQVITGEPYPVSLVSDPTAEVFLISKQDIQRKLPKRLFAILFPTEQEVVPNDRQILDMHRQTQRWDSFRSGLHREALSARRPILRSMLRVEGSSGRSDVLANLDFLGVQPESAKEVLPGPAERRGCAPLTGHDELYFSESSAGFLRNFDRLRGDRGIQKSMLRDGSANRLRPLYRGARGAADGAGGVRRVAQNVGFTIEEGGRGGSGEDSEGEEKDPNAFYFERSWAKVGGARVLANLGGNLEPMAVGGSAGDAPGGGNSGSCGGAQGGASEGEWTNAFAPGSAGGTGGGAGRGAFLQPLEKDPFTAGSTNSSRSGSRRPSIGLGASSGGAYFSAGGFYAEKGGAPPSAASTELPPLGSASLASLSTSLTSLGSFGGGGGAPHSARMPPRKVLALVATH